MNNSIEFVINQINKQNSSYKDRDFTQAHCCKLHELWFEPHSDKVKIVYSPDDEYQYFIGRSDISDGTSLFFHNLVTDVVSGLKDGTSYYLPDGYRNYNKTYYIGDLIVLEEVDDRFAPPEKPWLKQRTTMCLPVRVEYR